jgi:hypothetical protein
MYAFIRDVPADEHIYGEIKQRLGSTPPPGLISHVVFKYQDGLRNVDVWDTESAWERYRDEAVEPAVRAVLEAHGVLVDFADVEVEPIEMVDALVGTATT